MRDKIINCLYKMAVILFAIIFIYIFGLNIFCAFKEKKIISVFLFLLLLVGYSALFWRIRKINFKYKKTLTWIFLFISFCNLLILGYKTRVSLYNTWDYGGLIRCSYDFAHGKMTDSWYFARYPNNIPLLLFLGVIGKICLFFYKGMTLGTFRAITIVLNALIIFSSFLLLYQIIKKNIGEESTKLTTFVCIFFCPLYLYCAILYTDTVSMLLMLISLYCYLLYDESKTKSKKIISFLFLIVFIYLGFRMKATNIFLFIALILEFLRERKWKEILYSIVLLLVISIPISFGIKNGYKLSSAEIDKYQFPYSHWLMMTLNPTTTGGYNWDDVNYTISFEGYEAKKIAIKKRLKERIRDYDGKKLIYRILVTKNIRTWTNPTIETSTYLGTHPISPNIITSFVTTKGKNYKYYNLYITAIYLFLLFGSILSSYYNIKEKNKLVFLSQLMLIGIFLFELVWECNARYIYNFLPFLVITACYGYTKWGKMFKERKRSIVQEV